MLGKRAKFRCLLSIPSIALRLQWAVEQMKNFTFYGLLPCPNHFRESEILILVRSVHVKWFGGKFAGKEKQRLKSLEANTFDLAHHWDIDFSEECSQGRPTIANWHSFGVGNCVNGWKKFKQRSHFSSLLLLLCNILSS